MKTWKSVAMGAVLALLPLSSHAFLLDAEIGAAAWSQAPSGSAETSANNSVDVERDLGLDSEVSGFVWAVLEPALLPNVRVRYTPMSFSGEETNSFQWRGQPLTGNIVTDAELNQLDLTMYFQPLNNVVKLALGLNVKLVDGEFHVREKSQSVPRAISFSAPLPMLYAHAGVSVPLTGLSAKVEGAAIAYDDNRVVDITAGLRYKVLPLLHLEAGYRHQELRVDHDDIFVDMKVAGPYAGAVLRF